MKAATCFVVLVLSLVSVPTVMADSAADDTRWFSDTANGKSVKLYFYWSRLCPHCLEAKPFIEQMAVQYPWIDLDSREIYAATENRAHFAEMAGHTGFQPTSVPAFVWCGKHKTGYSTNETTGAELLTALAVCYRQHYGDHPELGQASMHNDADTAVQLPLFGMLNIRDLSLPTLAVVLGGIDAFNPCAFFVLLFLLSLLVNTHSRSRMLLVGSLFVLVSGLVYFAFMAAWLNLFQLLGSIGLITLIAGTVAVLFGAINIKDYFWFRQGISLSLSDDSRSRLLDRMRRLMNTEHLPSLLIGTLSLAVAANSYELLCTMGLPMVFTRILTLEELPQWHYYGYLALYNLVYVVPLAVIVGLFVATMGRRKLTESEGRFLKLLSGSMMLGLGIVLVLAPEYLSNPLLAIALILLALLSSLFFHHVWKRRGE